VNRINTFNSIKPDTMKNHQYPLIFIVGDNPVYNTLVVNHLRTHKLNHIESFRSGEECLKNISRKPNIIIQDYLLEGINGIDVLVATKKKYPEIDFIFLSGQDKIEVAINCMKFGASDYLVKDQYALNKLTDKINKILIHRERISSNKKFRHGITLFFIALTLIIVIFAALTILFPTTFSILGN
jgi:DNA-binding NtrC family response regulator